MIGRLLYKIFKRFFLKHYFLEQSKRKGFEKMEKAFVDSNGRIYYSPVNDFDLPHRRTLAIEKALMRLRAGLSDEDYDLILNTMEKALNSGKKSELALIGHCIIEMRKRKDLALHPELLFDIAAYRYIREDEVSGEIDQEIHKQKIKQFELDSKGGLYDFFYKAGLEKYIPYLKTLEPDWEEYMIQSKIKIQALQHHLKAYTTEST